MAPQKVFYSWQSWNDKAANHNFIQDCLERAIKAIRNDDSLALDPVIDRDTQGAAGAADIAATILDKISSADVFVADVSFVNDGSASRLTPNPNVLVELGYALARLGPERIIAVLNRATGRIEDLPFDLRGRSVVPYDLPAQKSVPDEAVWLDLRTEARKSLVGRLKGAIVAILDAPDLDATQFLIELAESLNQIIIFGSEVEDRPINPGKNHMESVLNSQGQHLRAIAYGDMAMRLGLCDSLIDLASALEQVTSASVTTRGNAGLNVTLIKRTVELAMSMKSHAMNAEFLAPSNLADIHRALFEMKRRLDGLLSRLQELMTRPAGIDEAQETAQELGLNMCRFGQYNLDRIQVGLATRLSQVGHGLHLVGVSRQYVGGMGRSLRQTQTDLTRLASEFRTLVDSLPAPR